MIHCLHGGIGFKVANPSREDSLDAVMLDANEATVRSEYEREYEPSVQRRSARFSFLGQFMTCKKASPPLHLPVIAQRRYLFHPIQVFGGKPRHREYFRGASFSMVLRGDAA